jgi:hypothetical protein
MRKTNNIFISNKVLSIITIIAIFSAFVFLITKIGKGYNSLNYSLDEINPTTYQMLKEDSILFNANSIKRVKTVQIRNSKVRNSVSWLIVDNKYPLFIYKIDDKEKLSFKDSILIRDASTDRTTGVVYNIIDDKSLFYKFQYKAGTVKSPSAIYLSIKGDSIQQTCKNDSMICFNALCNNMSVSYKSQSEADIFIEGKQKGFSTLSIPMVVLFLQHGNSTYLLVLTSLTSNSAIPKNILESLLR